MTRPPRSGGTGSPAGHGQPDARAAERPECPAGDQLGTVGVQDDQVIRPGADGRRAAPARPGRARPGSPAGSGRRSPRIAGRPGGDGEPSGGPEQEHLGLARLASRPRHTRPRRAIRSRPTAPLGPRRRAASAGIAPRPPAGAVRDRRAPAGAGPGAGRRLRAARSSPASGTITRSRAAPAGPRRSARRTPAAARPADASGRRAARRSRPRPGARGVPPGCDGSPRRRRPVVPADPGAALGDRHADARPRAAGRPGPTGAPRGCWHSGRPAMGGHRIGDSERCSRIERGYAGRSRRIATYPSHFNRSRARLTRCWRAASSASQAARSARSVSCSRARAAAATPSFRDWISPASSSS